MVKGQQCLVCGRKNKVTIHHMRDVHQDKGKRRKYPLNGIIYLCRDCHDFIEEIATKKKIKKQSYERGYQKGFSDGKKAHEFYEQGGSEYIKWKINIFF